VFTVRYGLDIYTVQLKYISLHCAPSFSKLTAQPKRSVSSPCAVLPNYSHLTFFTSQRSALPPAYHKVLPGNLQASFTWATQSTATSSPKTGGWPPVHRRLRDTCRLDVRQTLFSISENESWVQC